MPVFGREVPRPQPPAHRCGQDAVRDLTRQRHHQPDEPLAAATGIHAGERPINRQLRDQEVRSAPFTRGLGCALPLSA